MSRKSRNNKGKLDKSGVDALIEYAVNGAVERAKEGLEMLLFEAAATAPMDTGELRESGYVSVNGKVIMRSQKFGNVQKFSDTSKNRGSNARLTIGFSAGHAKVQHENLVFKHKRGKAKFLESPWIRDRALIISNIKESKEGSKVRNDFSGGTKAIR